jgi:hypothetical protein
VSKTVRFHKNRPQKTFVGHWTYLLVPSTVIPLFDCHTLVKTYDNHAGL